MRFCFLCHWSWADCCASCCGLTAIAAAAALVSWLIAWNPPYGGNEGFYFRAYMLTSFTVGSFITGGILLYRRKQN